MYTRRIFNLTQHAPSQEQITAGVQDLPMPEHREELKQLLNFDELPSKEEVAARAARLADLVYEIESGYGEYDAPRAAALIGGAPFLMGPLEAALKARGITPLYAFSRRESVETTDPDGSVRKTAVFRHIGFVEA